MKKFYKITLTIIIIALSAAFTIALIHNVLEDVPRCDWANCRIYGKANNYREYRLCNKCDSDLKMLSGEALGMTFYLKGGEKIEEWDAERRNWIYEKIKTRKNIDRTPKM